MPLIYWFQFETTTDTSQCVQIVSECAFLFPEIFVPLNWNHTTTHLNNIAQKVMSIKSQMHKKIKSPSENSLSHCHFRDFALPKPSSTPLNSQKWSQWQVPVNQFQGWNFLFIPDQPIYDISYHLQANNCQLLDMQQHGKVTSFPSWILPMLSWFYVQERFLSCPKTILGSRFHT